MKIGDIDYGEGYTKTAIFHRSNQWFDESDKTWNYTFHSGQESMDADVRKGYIYRRPMTALEMQNEKVATSEPTQHGVDHPPYYGGAEDPYEAIKVIEAWELGFNLGNLVKYIPRAGKKEGNTRLKDLKKGLWYLQREIALEEAK